MRKLLFAGLLSMLSITTTKAQCSTSVLEAFGATSSLAVYNTYITIGTIADGYVGETYDAEYTIDLMDEQITMISTVVDYIDKILNDSKSGVSADDKDYLREMKACLNDLYDEAEGLKEYATDNNSGTDKYNAARDAAWAKIEELLGLNDE